MSHYLVTAVFKAHHLLRSHQSNHWRAPASLQKDCVNVGPMNQRVGITKSVAKFLSQRDARDFFRGDTVHHQEALGKHSRAAEFIPATKPVEHFEDIRSKLNTSSDLLELACLLNQADAVSTPA